MRRSKTVASAVLFFVVVAFQSVSAADYSLVTSRSNLSGSDILDWSQMGSPGSVVSNPFSISSALGQSVTVSEASGAFNIFQQSSSPFSTWGGNFAVGDPVLYTGSVTSGGGHGPITLDFGSTGVSAAGAQINGNFASNTTSTFTARITALDSSNNVLASFTEPGFSNANADNSAIFVGVQSTVPNIHKIQIGLDSISQSSTGDFAINKVGIVPHPTGAFDFSSIAAGAPLNIVGNAHLAANVLRLTDAQPLQAGAAWYSSPLFVRNGFDTTFDFQMSGGSGQADGLAFVIQNASPQALGIYGGGIGYSGIPNSLAVEFDTWRNTEDPGEVNNNHIAVMSRGTQPNSSGHVEAQLALNANLPIDLHDQSIHKARVSYTNGNLSVSVDGSAVISTPVNLASLLSLNNGSAYLGFTAGTGGANQNQDVRSWSFNASVTPPAPPTRIEPHQSPKTKNLVVITNGWAGPVPNDNLTQAWMTDMKNAIQAKINERSDAADWTVETFDWTQASNLIPNSNTGAAAWNSAFNVAQQYGLAQGSYWGTQGYNYVHLIGHSAGAGFLDSAARAIKGKAGNTTSVQLTFLDAFASQQLADDGLGEAADWSDHYFSSSDIPFTNAHMPQAHNVDVTNLAASPSHFWPVEFYRYSIDGATFQNTLHSQFPTEPFNPAPVDGLSQAQVAGTTIPYGFALSLEGGNWYKNLSPSIQQTLAKGTAIVLGSQTIYPSGIPVQTPVQMTTVDVFDSSAESVFHFDDGVQLTTHSPAWTVFREDLEDAAALLKFELEYTSAAGAEGLLSVYIDNDLVGSIDERYALPGNNVYTFPTSDLTPGLHDIAFRLDPFTTISSQVSISNLQFLAVPEPSALRLTAAFIFFVVVSRRMPRQYVMA